MSAPGLGRPFWTLFVSSTVSNLGDGIGRVALPLLAATLTRDPLLIGSLSSFVFVPWLMFALLSGALVDRMDRRKVMIAANLFRSVVVGGLAVAVFTEQAAVWMLFVAAFILGAAETLYDSAARAILPGVVRRDQLAAGNGRLESGEVVAQNFLGAPLASSLFVLVAAGPFLANSAGFLLAALLLLLLPGSHRAKPAADAPVARPNLRREIAEGFGWLWGHRLFRPFVLVAAFGAAAVEGATALIVLLIIDVMALPEASYGFFALVLGVGGLIGGLTTPVLLRRFRRRTLLVVSQAAMGLSYLLVGLAPVPVLAAVTFFLAGVSVLMFNVVSMSMRQAIIPSHLFGRVQGAWRTLAWGMLPLGGLLGGLLARVTDVPTVFLVSGGVGLVVAVILALLLKARGQEIDELDDSDWAELRGATSAQAVADDLPAPGAGLAEIGGDPSEEAPAAAQGEKRPIGEAAGAQVPTP
ncbi:MULTISPECIES: MFS transporter [Actinoalloteichus]|uniref:Arabinose efflux permease family protein n=1 Tax=Actinoalloteichus fjordicus TaxID=1612552 RepID=A0AAC9LGU5_9PSEU|nr:MULTISPECIES: MFS transporter [Actinoalloteichus]APU17548.1 arabinose efflux permease family protein [Actinoalloteichus fjordicus]APU23626.1 arabinose efflux permease family protein [Actinoalloteichus sp. GBA129-24]